MSIVAPLHREPVEATERKSMTPARKRRISQRQDGICGYPECTAPIEEYDHIVCLAIGGRDTDDNCEGLCADHHKRKTALDLKLIAKARRRRLKDRGEFPPAKQKLRGRGFDRRWTP
jgi:5-methylcytosine-specific restriction endonuclease McrA